MPHTDITLRGALDKGGIVVRGARGPLGLSVPFCRPWLPSSYRVEFTAVWRSTALCELGVAYVNSCIKASSSIAQGRFSLRRCGQAFPYAAIGAVLQLRS